MRRVLLIAIASIATGSTGAQPLVDPMRPPATILSSSIGAGSALPNATAARPIVQTIIIGPDRRYAVIDGRAVGHGDQVRGMQVVRIAESSVTLRDVTGKNLEIDLLPGVGKKFSASATQPERAAALVREFKQ